MNTQQTSVAAQQQSGKRINANASPGRIEQQIDAKRADINRTLSQLEDRFSPQKYMDQGVDLLREHGGDMVQSLVRSVKDNPAPFMVAGVGLAWLITATSSQSGYQRHGGQHPFASNRSDSADLDRESDVHDGSSRYRDTTPYDTQSAFDTNTDKDEKSLADKTIDNIDALGDRLSSMGNMAADSMESAKDSAARHGRQLQRQSAERVESWRQSGRDLGQSMNRHGRSVANDATDFLQERPMVAGAIGAAIGAMIGSIVPGTRAENRYFGSYADEARSSAEAMSSDSIERARKEVEKVAEAAGSTAASMVHEADRKLDSQRA